MRRLAVVAVICALNVGLVLAKNPPLDVCALLSPAQLQKTLGQPFSSPEKSTAPPAYAGDPSGTQCEFHATQGSSIKVVLIAYVDPSAAHATQTFNKLAAFYKPKSKPAIGDSAYTDANGAIHVLKGSVRYFIDIEPVGASKANPYVSWMGRSQSSPDTSEKEKRVEALATAVAGVL